MQRLLKKELRGLVLKLEPKKALGQRHRKMSSMRISRMWGRSNWILSIQKERRETFALFVWALLIFFSFGEKMWKFFEKLKTGLSKTHQGFVEKIDQLFLGKKEIDQDVLAELEGLLFEVVLGVKPSAQLIEGVRQGLKRGELKEPEKVKDFIKQEILRILKTGEEHLSIDFSQTRPFVFMVVGVNGGGKTTTIGKIAHQYSSQGKKALVGAAD